MTSNRPVAHRVTSLTTFIRCLDLSFIAVMLAYILIVISYVSYRMNSPAVKANSTSGPYSMINYYTIGAQFAAGGKVYTYRVPDAYPLKPGDYVLVDPEDPEVVRVVRIDSVRMDTDRKLSYQYIAGVVTLVEVPK